MGSPGTSGSSERIIVEERLLNWFRGQGVSEEGASRAVKLLHGPTLAAAPRPSRWNRRGEFKEAERCRYLWYRHAARILRWCDRTKFPTEVTDILRQKIFPTAGGDDEAAGQVVEGGVSAVGGGRPLTTHGDQQSACQSQGLG